MEYLDKIIQLPFCIPPCNTEALQKLAADLTGAAGDLLISHTADSGLSNLT